jgi:hypothetical protein
MVFLTGDRSLDKVTAVVAAAAVLSTLPEDTEVATGRLGGFEAAVRYLVPDAAIYGTADTADESLDARHVAAAEDMSEAVIFHTDPLASRIFKSAARTWGDDALTIYPS